MIKAIKNGQQYLLILFFSLVLIGCDGRECQNENNNKALSIITDGLKMSNNNVWSCGYITDRYEYFISFYGLDSNDTKAILNNVAKAADVPNAKIRIHIYSDYWAWEHKTPPPSNNPMFTIKIDTKLK